MGYNTTKHVYTYHIVRTSGDTEGLQGTLDGRTWTWTSDEVQRSEPSLKTRITMQEISSTLYTLRVETSLPGGAWSTVMEGNARKMVSQPHRDVAFMR